MHFENLHARRLLHLGMDLGGQGRRDAQQSSMLLAEYYPPTPHLMVTKELHGYPRCHCIACPQAQHRQLSFAQCCACHGEGLGGQHLQKRRMSDLLGHDMGRLSHHTLHCGICSGLQALLVKQDEVQGHRPKQANTPMEAHTFSQSCSLPHASWHVCRQRLPPAVKVRKTLQSRCSHGKPTVLADVGHPLYCCCRQLLPDGVRVRRTSQSRSTHNCGRCGPW